MDSSARASNLSALKARHYPLLLTGLEVPYDNGIKAIEENSTSYKSLRPLFSLLVVVDDRCGVCQRALPDFLAFLPVLRDQPTVEVEIVSLQGMGLGKRLFDRARDLGLQSRLLVPTETLAYTAATGLVGTPALVVLDADRRIRLQLRGFNRTGLDKFALLIPNVVTGRGAAQDLYSLRIFKQPLLGTKGGELDDETSMDKPSRRGLWRSDGHCADDGSVDEGSCQ